MRISRETSLEELETGKLEFPSAGITSIEYYKNVSVFRFMQQEISSPLW